MQRLEMEEIRQREANETALQAIGFPKKRLKAGSGMPSTGGSSGAGSNGPGSISGAGGGGSSHGGSGSGGANSSNQSGSGGSNLFSNTSKPVSLFFDIPPVYFRSLEFTIFFS